MSINPATDIVLDVARAADPARYKRAVAKLDATAGAGFTDSLAAVSETAPARAPAAAPMPIVPEQTATQAATASVAQPGAPTAVPKPSAAATDKAAATYQQFEAMALANMLEAAMPSDGENFFGKGVAGSTWKSMMLDQIAAQLAKHGGVGIADELARAEAGHSTKQLAAAGAMTLAKPTT